MLAALGAPPPLMDPDIHRKSFDMDEHYWWSVGTRAIFREWLLDAVTGPVPRVLDLGCGTGMLAKQLGAHATVHALDVDAEAVAFSRRRGVQRLVRGSAEALPFEASVFDAVAAVDVVEHTDFRRTLPEIARVLAPGGIALVHVPAFAFLWGEHDEAAHHQQRYHRRELRERLEAQGLRVERLSYVNCLLFAPVSAVRLAKRLTRPLRRPHPPRAEIYALPRPLNAALTRLLRAEGWVMRRMALPVGVSLLCVARKAR